MDASARSPEFRKAKGSQSAELPRAFVPTPERVSQFLERNTKEVATQLASVDGRKKVLADLLKHEKDLRKLDPAFSPQDLQRQLDLVGETLEQKQRFSQEVKKGFLRRQFDRVKGFVVRHPFISVALLVAATAAGIGGAAYMAGGFEALLAKIGLSHITAAGAAADPLGSLLNGAGGPMSGSLPGSK